MEELENYREIYREMNIGEEAPQLLMVVFTCCYEDENIAHEKHVKYTCCYSKSALDHYKLDNEGLTYIKGGTLTALHYCMPDKGPSATPTVQIDNDNTTVTE